MDTISVTVQGIPVVVDPSQIGSFEFLEWLYDLQNGDPTPLVPMARTMFGREQFANIKRTLKKEGRGDVENVSRFVVEAITAAAEAKGADAKN